VEQAPGQGHHLGFGLQHLFDLRREVGQGLHVAADLLIRQDAPAPAQVQRQQVEDHELRRESLRGSHSDLGARVRVERSMRLPRRHRAHHVADGQAPGPARLRLPEGAIVSAVSPDWLTKTWRVSFVTTGSR